MVYQILTVKPSICAIFLYKKDAENNDFDEKRRKIYIPLDAEEEFCRLEEKWRRVYQIYREGE